ncbi:hypothetical protein ACQRIU_000538 [Beauveria bassiana]
MHNNHRYLDKVPRYSPLWQDLSVPGIPQPSAETLVEQPTVLGMDEVQPAAVVTCHLHHQNYTTQEPSLPKIFLYRERGQLRH